ncbi:glycosyltransferase family 2 protein [Leeuwenhoekiella parthenopeia]|uniref:Glycosyltransferase family 2 protein n=1 Tax=Leeuwenhoekiella parthenopeia TaxID=2890320 RepID=A0ABS8GXH5_9FLAO|nr:glycosyltransferase family A protein [Leeuwenhoekiella parthenopeia]MCC4214662.1 glycosyltransferase family 2 protein [Leeuwenhoekiella parthenopeia]
MDEPLISIIIPTYNRANVINETLDSVLAQTYTHWECIVVDDGSTDDTALLLNTYNEQDHRFKYLFRTKEPKGASSCRNLGLQNAKGEFCIFLDSDDMLLTSCFEQRLEMAMEYPNYDFYVYPMKVQMNSELKIKKIEPSESYLNDFLKNNIPWGIMSTFWKMGFIRKLNGFNISYPRLNDPEIHIRALIFSTNGYYIGTEEQADTIYRVSNAALDKTSFSRKYADSLLLFVNDITAHLRKVNLNDKIFLLVGYLSEYFLDFALYNTRINNHKVLAVFYKNKVIDLRSLMILFSVYYCKVFTLKIDSLTTKTFIKKFKNL